MNRNAKDEASGETAPEVTVVREGKPGRNPGALPSRWISWMEPISSVVTGSIDAPHDLVLRRIPLSEVFIGSMRELGTPAEVYELIQSVSDLGLIEPPVAVPRPEGGYELVAGFRRFLASLIIAEYEAGSGKPDPKRMRGAEGLRKALRAESREMKDKGIGFVDKNGKSDGIREAQIAAEVRGYEMSEEERLERTVAVVGRTRIPVVVHLGASEDWIRLARQHENIVRKSYSSGEAKAFALGRSGPRALSTHYMPVDVADRLGRRYQGAIPLWGRMLQHLDRMQSELDSGSR